MSIFEEEDLVEKEYKERQKMAEKEINDIILSLRMYSDMTEKLTKEYTKILLDDNVAYILTRLSQNQIFKKHFPEFYLKNQYGESVLNCQQNTIYHRYGVFKHILCTIENVGKNNLKFNADELKILKWAMFLHDVGKPMSKLSNGQGVDSFAGHDDMSVDMARNILNRFCFTEKEKQEILTLIKYHDKFLNEGDLTYDNLSYLAKELGNKKELFYMLVEVKEADNKAKSIDVYNKFVNIKSKYYDFMSEYFGAFNDKELLNENNDSDDNNELAEEMDESEYVYKTEKSVENENSDVETVEEITEKIITGICKDITAGKAVKYYYQPIIDLQDKIVHGYEVFYKVLTQEKFSYKHIITKAKEFNKYDKLQQMLFINGLDELDKLNVPSTTTKYINIDVKSYKNYVNKPRIFERISGKNIVIEFNNFEIVSDTVFKELVAELNKVQAKVAIDNFESTNRTIKELERIEPKVIKYRIEKTDENIKKELQDLLAFAAARSVNLICFGIDTKEKLNFALELGVRYVQGECFGKPREDLTMTKSKIEKVISEIQDDNIF